MKPSKFSLSVCPLCGKAFEEEGLAESCMHLHLMNAAEFQIRIKKEGQYAFVEGDRYPRVIQLSSPRSPNSALYVRVDDDSPLLKPGKARVRPVHVR